MQAEKGINAKCNMMIKDQLQQYESWHSAI